MKKILIFILIITATISCLASCSKLYYCDNCHTTYTDGNPHHVSDDTGDLTLCEVCYSEYIENKKTDEGEVSNSPTKEVLTKEQALEIAEQHWHLNTGDIDSGNGFKYRIGIVATPTDVAPYYVAYLSWLVNYLPDSNEQHYSLVEKIYIDAISGECTVEYGMQSVSNAYKKMLIHKNQHGNVSDINKDDYRYISTRTFEELKDIVSQQHVYSAAYALKDLNNDGKDELLLLDWHYNIWGIFTKVNDIPILVNDFNNINSFAAIDENGVIYTSAYTKGETTHNGVWQLSRDGTLNGLSFGCIDYTGFFYDAVVTYYKNVDGKELDITEEEYTALESEYSHIFRDFNTTTESSGIEIQYIFEFKSDSK